MTKEFDDLLKSIKSPVEDERKEMWRTISKQNRARSGRMERNLASKLKGIRVPYSGAGVMKADVFVRLPNDLSYVVECKSTAAAPKGRGPSINLLVSWLVRLEKNVVSMASWNTKFGALAFRYHGIGEDFFAIPTQWLSRIPKLIQLELDSPRILSVASQYHVDYDKVSEQTDKGKAFVLEFIKFERAVLIVNFSTFKEAIDDEYYKASDTETE